MVKNYMNMRVMDQTVERPKRKVNIKDIGRISELDFKENECHFKIRVICGKGTYIRTLATDIGVKLGFPAHMSKLTRIGVWWICVER